MLHYSKQDSENYFSLVRNSCVCISKSWYKIPEGT